MPFSLPFLATGPWVRVTPLAIEGRTSRLIAVLTLGMWLDQFIIDSGIRVVTIRRSRFWFFRAVRRIRFADVEHIVYSMHRGSSETYTVGLALTSEEEILLTRFSGNGAFSAEFSLPQCWLENQVREMIDLTGDQQERSLGLVDTLCERLGVSLGPSRHF